MMTPEQIQLLGLTRDPSETGALHDVYARSDGGPYYVAADAMSGILRRAAHRDRREIIPDDDLKRMAGPPPKRVLTLGRRPRKPSLSSQTATCVGCGGPFRRPAGGAPVARHRNRGGPLLDVGNDWRLTDDGPSGR